MPSQAQQGVQKGPSPLRTFPRKTMYVPNLSYAYDVAKDGRVNAAMTIINLAAKTVAAVPNCPVSYGAKVTGTGAIRGFDYLNQPVGETLAGASKNAYGAVTQAPAGVTWLNEYGLPYAYYGPGQVDANATYTAPTGVSGEDPRGFVKFTSQPPDGTRFLLSFVPILGNLYGARHANPAPIPLSIEEAVEQGVLPMPTPPLTQQIAKVREDAGPHELNTALQNAPAPLLFIYAGHGDDDNASCEFDVAGGLPPYRFAGGDLPNTIAIVDDEGKFGYDYRRNGSYTAIISDSAGQSMNVGVKVDWLKTLV